MAVQDITGKWAEIANDVETLASMLSESIGPASKRGEDTKSKIDEIYDVLVEIRDNFKDEMKNDKKYTQDVVEAVEKMSGGPKAKGKRGIGGGGGGGGRGGGGGGGFDDFDPKKAGVDFAERLHKSFRVAYHKRMAAWITGFGTMLAGGFNPVQTIFARAFTDQRKFTRNMRAVAYETQGITKETRGLQKEFAATGKIAVQTGRSLSEFQEVWINNLRQGVKSQKEGLSVAKTSLHVAAMIGDENNAIAGTLRKWNMEMGLNANQMAQVGRNVQEVARWTGVTGEHLVKAVESSEKFVRNMRNAGTLSASATKQIMLMVAEAQKLGIGDQMETVLDAATSSTKFFLEASTQTKALLATAAGSVGEIAKLQTGELMQTRGGQAKMAEGLENVLERFGVGFEDLENLSGQRLMQLNMTLKKAYGVESQELKRMWESMKQGSMSFAERMEDLKTQMKNTNLTTEEKIALEKKYQDQLMSTGKTN